VPGYELLDARGTVRLNDGSISEQFTLQEITNILDEARLRISDLERDSLAYLITCKKA
jgi:hypothetical protein